MTKPRAFLLATVATAFAFLAFTGVASAACSLTPVTDSTSYATSVTTNGTFTADQSESYVQIPFNVPASTSGIRIRYCYENNNGATVDMGVYQPKSGGDTQFGMNESRGWTGSALRNIAIAQNGFTDTTTYNAGRKDFVPGRTTRGYRPGPIQAGQWAIELGLGWIPPVSDDANGIQWTVEVSTTTDSSWSNDAYVPDPYVPSVANPAAGWYDGDFHAHGEEEPGNAPMSQTFNKGFNPGPTGNNLDFMTLVDHNNTVARGEIGRYDQDHPGKLIIPGTEETTYDGHFNSLNADSLVDFRTGPILSFTDGNANNNVDSGELTQVRGPVDPSAALGAIGAAGGWAQINHPTIYAAAPSVCRGCAWSYSDAQTDFSKVNSIEISTGPAVLPANQNPMSTSANPFLASAIDYYEHALSTGAHIAASASSDDHKGGDAVSATDSQVGRGATAVYATELSPAAITAGVKAGHTYAKPFGADAPDVTMTASSPGQTSAIPGDSITGPTASIAVNVKNAGAGATRPGTYTLEILKDGTSVSSTPINSDDFNYSYTATATGRYSFEVSRTPASSKLVEDYSTPIWFTQKVDPIPPVVSNAFKIVKTSLNKKKGTAAIKVKVTSPGSISSTGKGVAKSTAKVKKAGATVTLNVKATGKTRKALKKKGKAKVKLTITNRPTGGKTKSVKKSVTLKLKKKKR